MVNKIGLTYTKYTELAKGATLFFDTVKQLKDSEQLNELSEKYLATLHYCAQRLIKTENDDPLEEYAKLPHLRKLIMMTPHHHTSTAIKLTKNVKGLMSIIDVEGEGEFADQMLQVFECVNSQLEAKNDDQRYIDCYAPKSDKHLRFLGIPITGTLEEFNRHLIRAGADPIELEDDIEMWEMVFCGHQSIVSVEYVRKGENSFVYEVDVTMHFDEKEDIESFYDSMREKLRHRYYDAKVDEDFLIMPEGEVYIAICQDNTIYLTYTDYLSEHNALYGSTEKTDDVLADL